jgi:hypothetical protein
MTDRSRAPDGWPLYLAFSVFALSGACAAQEAESAFAGAWRGTIQTDASYGVTGESDTVEGFLAPREFDIRIPRDDRVNVRIKTRGESWRPYAVPLALIESGDTAVLMGQHRSAYWVESVSFNITKIDEGTLLVYWWRVVNNTQIHPDDPMSKFAVGGYGEFRRRGR